jgi:iron uptake system EfeUOB component EfeO/EfeM
VATVLIAAVAALASACTSAGSAAGARPGPGPSAPTARLASSDRSLAQAASSAYRTTLDDDAAELVVDVDRLQSAVGSGDIAAARTDELSAQVDYDGIRMVLESADPVIASTLDEDTSAVAPGQALAGLHAVESDLWSSPPSNGSADMTGVVAQAPVAAYLLARDTLAPATIGTTAVDELGWVDDVAIPGHEETFSHLGAVDMAATTGAAQAAYVAIRPLARRIAPRLSGSVEHGFATLAAEVAALGPPDQRPDATIPPSTLRSLSETVNATASLLAELSARLVPFGTFGTSS